MPQPGEEPVGGPTTTGADITTIAYDASYGTQIWSKRYNGPADGDVVGLAVGVSPDGTVVFVTGGSEGSPGDRDFLTVAYSASDGTRLWNRRYQGADGTSDQADGLQVAPDARTVFVTGPSYASASAASYVTIAYDAVDGTQLWARSTSGYPQRNALSVSRDGSRFFMSGTAIGSTSVIDYTTVALDASTGHKLWGRRFNGTANGNDFGTAVGVSPTGTKVYVTGSSQGSTENDFQYVCRTAKPFCRGSHVVSLALEVT